MPSCVTGKLNITIVEGGTFDRSFQWQTGDPAVPVVLTGYTAKMEVRAKITDALPLITLAFVATPWAADGVSGVYIEDRDPDGWWYRAYIKDNDSLGLCAAHKDIPEGVYDLFLYSSEGEAVLKQFGAANIIAAVTR